jgi:beta-lactamase superfamily II metal-dependent hydrolase
MATALADAATPRYFLLDMGKEKFGDCLVCLIGGKTILIDGGHTGDFDGQQGSTSIPDQIGAILGTEPPYAIDLLIVTHAHIDHIGCLPRMVREGLLEITTALVADERLGWGKPLNGPDSDAFPDSPIAARIVAGLREEQRADDFEDDAAVARFLADAVSLEQSYTQMLTTLTERGTTVLRYGRDDLTGRLHEFDGIGLTILGPTNAHLEICRAAIASSMSDAAADAIRLLDSDAAASDVDIYRRLAADSMQDATADGNRLGSALNDQSIVVALGPPANRVLLTGDMQFADPAVNGLDAEMIALRHVVAGAAPYKFIKLAHHGSHNGINDEVRAEWQATKLFAISGGSNDPSHPAREVLTLLKHEQDSITWARTDKNGGIEVRPSSTSEPFIVAKGDLNTSTANRRPPKKPDEGVLAPVEIVPPPGVAALTPSGVLEVTTRIPSYLRRVVITVDSEPFPVAGSRSQSVQPRAGTLLPSPSPPAPQRGLSTRTREGSGPGPEPASDSLGAGHRLPPLLFVSNRKTLRENIGRSEADEAIALIEAAGQTYLDVSDAARAVDEVRARISGDHRGVVLLGGYDVLPAQRLDTLPPQLRTDLGDRVNKDADRFIVWSDAIYGDRDNDGLPEIPVSRIPDGKSSLLVLNALRARGVTLAAERFSIYNARREFAPDVIKIVPGLAEALVSLPSTSSGIVSAATAVPLVYFMLHGYDTDGTRFAGQEPEFPEAFNIDHVPQNGGGVVFTGCCWGALTVRQIASRVPLNGALTPRTPDQSIALRYLKAGYNAFVGCTGSHYSPPGNEMSHGKPMHVAFWQRLIGGLGPSEALFQAKIQYLRDLPHGLDDRLEIATEHKILRQYTCLGLGW